MWVLVGFAFISGIITILSPCILPILPVVLSGGVSGGKARPFGVVTGFVASFLFFTLSLSTLVKATGVSPEIPRYIALVILVAFGIVMIVPMLRYRFELWVSGFVSRSKGSRAASQQARPTASAGALSGYGSGIVMGLGLVSCGPPASVRSWPR